MASSTSLDGEPENLWNKILSEASRSVQDRLESKNVLVLGDKNSGKSTLITRLQNLDISEMRRGIALDYSFIDIHSSETDDDTVARLNVWQLEGELEHNNLLKFALNPSTIGSTVVLITVDFTQPWNISESINKWLGVLQKHVSSVSIQLPPDAHKELKNSLIFDFQNYTDSNSTTKTIQKKKRPVDEQTLLPLKDGVLTHNFGIPIIVACCKTDCFLNLENEFNYKENHYDFIQQYIRRICLSYGAGLIYTSAKKDKNCSLLLQYIRHILYGTDNYFETKAQLLEKETIFVPIGADSIAKINVDFENQSLTKDPEEPYEDIIKIPKRLQQTAAVVEAVVNAEDDQEFLIKHKDIIEKDKSQEVKKTSKDGQLLQTLQKYGPSGTGSESPLVTGMGSGSTSTSISGSGSANGSVSSSKLPSVGDMGRSSPQVSTLSSSIDLKAPSSSSTSGSSNEHQVLSDFFNSLINKDSSRQPLSMSGIGGIGGSSSGGLGNLNLNRPPSKQSSVPSTSSTSTSSSSSTLPSSREDIAKQLEKIKNANKTT